MTTSYDIARSFLRAIGAPVTDGMTRAVAIWLRFESGSVVRGNNPWNLHSGAPCTAEKGYCPGQGSLPGQIGNRYAGTGDRNVAVFRTIDDGVNAAANNLTKRPAGDWTGYDKVVAAARSGNPVGFLTALQSSKWSAGHYSYSKLVAAFASALPYNTTITFKNYVEGEGVTNVIGKGIEGTAREAPLNPIEAAGAILGAVLDPQNWLYALALVGGGILVAYGARQIISSTASMPTVNIRELAT